MGQGESRTKKTGALNSNYATKSTVEESTKNAHKENEKIKKICEEAEDVESSEYKPPPFQKMISLTNAIKPNGFFPPELALTIMNSADFATFQALHLSCKMWYHTAFTTKFSNFMLQPGANLIKGRWWTESLATLFNVRLRQYDYVSYFASFSGNTAIINYQGIMSGSGERSTEWSRADKVDLTTMKREAIQFGCVFAQDYILRCETVIYDHCFFDWSDFQVMDRDQKPLYDIARKKRKTAPQPQKWGRLRHFEHIQLLVNQKPGRNTIVLWDFHLSTGLRNDKNEVAMTVEVYDLDSGKLIVEKQVEARRIISFYEDFIIVWYADRLSVLDLASDAETTLCSAESSSSLNTYATFAWSNIYDGKIAVTEKNKVKFFSFENHSFVHEIDLEEISTHCSKALGPDYRIGTLAFDKTKLIVNCISNQRFVNIVLELTSGYLLTTMFAHEDDLSPHMYSPAQIHFTDGKIVIDSVSALTVYDLTHPNANPDLSIPVAYLAANKLQVTRIKVNAIGSYASKKLNVPLMFLRMRTFYKKSNSKDQVRVTAIIRDQEPVYSFDATEPNPIFSGYTADQFQRSAWQLTLNNLEQVTEFLSQKRPGHEREADFLKADVAVLLYEKFNSKNQKWEFCRPHVNNGKIKLEKS